MKNCFNNYLQTPVDFRPIGLCNNLYKIISKCLAVRLSHVLPNIVVENQSAFTKHTRVPVTALTGLEIIHQIFQASKSINHMTNVAIKLDLSKTFDRIEWSFVYRILENLAFPHHFKNLIKCWLNSTYISIQYKQTKTFYYLAEGFIKETLYPLFF